MYLLPATQRLGSQHLITPPLYSIYRRIAIDQNRPLTNCRKKWGQGKVITVGALWWKTWLSMPPDDHRTILPCLPPKKQESLMSFSAQYFYSGTQTQLAATAKIVEAGNKSKKQHTTWHNLRFILPIYNIYIDEGPPWNPSSPLKLPHQTNYYIALVGIGCISHKL